MSDYEKRKEQLRADVTSQLNRCYNAADGTTDHETAGLEIVKQAILVLDLEADDMLHTLDEAIENCNEMTDIGALPEPHNETFAAMVADFRDEHARLDELLELKAAVNKSAYDLMTIEKASARTRQSISAVSGELARAIARIKAA